MTQAETQLTQITQEKENLQAQLDQTNLSKADTVLKASQSGILHVSDEFEGQTLLPQGSQIAEIYPDIAKTQQVAIRYYVDSTHVSQLKKGQTVRLTLEKLAITPLLSLAKSVKLQVLPHKPKKEISLR